MIMNKVSRKTIIKMLTYRTTLNIRLVKKLSSILERDITFSGPEKPIFLKNFYNIKQITQ